ncbi:hypothetical protein U3516DRAFT_51301 [Neocallimastix sp. 'constans']
MKYYNALFLLSALSLTLANNLEVSDFEGNDVANSGFDAGFGESSEPDIDHNEAPLENPIVPPSFPNTSNDTPIVPPSFPNTSNDTPVVPPSFPNTPVTDNTSDQTQNDSIPDFPSVDSEVPPVTDSTGNDSTSNDSVSGSDNTPSNEDAGEGSDDYGSDDYGETNANDTSDSANVNNNDVNAEAENSADEEESSTGTNAALGIAGAAALSSAGIFLWVKKSKRNNGYVQSVRTQITMV